MKSIAVIVGFLLTCVIVPVVNAEVFDIGENTSEIDGGSTNVFYYYDSGIWIEAKPETKNYIDTVFDNNLSTGIDEYIDSLDHMRFSLKFDNVIFVNFIDVDNTFGGGSNVYTLGITFMGGSSV